MIESIIGASLCNRFLAIVGSLLLLTAGVWALKQTPLDAIPDLSVDQIIVFTKYPGQAQRQTRRMLVAHRFRSFASEHRAEFCFR